MNNYTQQVNDIFESGPRYVRISSRVDVENGHENGLC